LNWLILTNLWPLDKNPTAQVQVHCLFILLCHCQQWKKPVGSVAGNLGDYDDETNTITEKASNYFGRHNTSLIAWLNLFLFLVAQFHCFTQDFMTFDEGPNTISPSYLWIWHLASSLYTQCTIFFCYNVQFGLHIFLSQWKIMKGQSSNFCESN